ncbi:MAG: type IX secretion system sortase PorU [Muribaculaceae bacterium]|nr:type IX secretion system sortase PorU [Muribaculaceae bacterium]
MTHQYLRRIMTTIYDHSRISRTLRHCACAAAALLYTISAYPHDPAKYAASSVLADGNWGKVRVSQTGIQFVSAATLRQLGFQDPQKVNVYGFGGRLQEDPLRESDPDDLPMLPSVKSAAGIWFFGHNHIRWSRTTSVASLSYEHSMQPYAEESWYFLSDRDASDPILPGAELPSSAMDESSVFTAMLLHEQELMHPSSSGRIYLGEDFRSTPSRNISFTLTDKASDDFRWRLAFGNRANVNSTVTVTPPQGDAVSMELKNLANSAGDFDDNYLRHSTSVGSGSSSSEQATLSVAYSCSGTSRFANLDYIEVEYTRRLALRDGQLYFPLYLRTSTRLSIANAESGMRIWDVTDHTRPVEVEYTLSGSTASFIAPSGNREYVAFVPQKGGYAVSDPTSVANQDLHSLNTPDMLIITPHEYLAAANTLAAHHREHDGFAVQVLEPEAIYNEFSSGTPDVGAFRRLMKMWYDRGQQAAPENGEPTGRIRYCLIMSRPTYDNKQIMEVTRSAGYPRIPIWQSPSGSSPTSSYPCDDYIGMLDDYNNLSFELKNQPIRVAVGRMPVRSASEAAAVVTKYIDYVTSTDTGSWRNEMLFLADDADNKDFNHMDQTEKMLNNMLASETARRFHIEKMYLDAYERVLGQKGATFPAAKERLLRLWESGLGYINYIGHASTVEWTHEKLLEWTDIQSFSNRNLPFLYAATCEFARIDQDNQSGAEVLWSNPQGGIIATICPTRSVLISNNEYMSNAMGTALFDDLNPGIGRRIGDILCDAKAGIEDDNKLRFTIVGDPAMRMRVPSASVAVTSIGDIDFEATPDEMAVIPARGRMEVAGVVKDNDGAVDASFNGTVEFTLYDAEKVVETRPYGNTSSTKFYNDRPTMLYKGMAKVEGGRWQTTLLLPIDVEQIYNPAQLSCYAYAADGREAHGNFSNFYIFGYDDSAEADDKGPEIQLFALNREDFRDGGVVHSSPVVMARVADESGINLSALGIGHQLTLTLDGRTYFDDVNEYYTPDPEDFTAGNILYPLPTLEAGEHTLRLTVWDNANNSSSADLAFTVAASKRPEIYELSTDVNPARDNVNFILSTDRPMASVDCMVEVFDLNGRRVWTSSRTTATDMLASLSIPWDLCSADGVRVPRGIYVYRATVTSPDGTSATRSKKLAVTAQ